jgi:hypothetical protein
VTAQRALADLRILDVQMTPKAQQRLRREAESFIEIALYAPDQFVAALALMSDEVVVAVADALCRSVLEAATSDPIVWGRVHMVAAALSDANLDDDDDVVRALYAARFRSEDFIDVLDDAIAVARERRAAP